MSVSDLDPIVPQELKDKAREMAKELRDECDGTYVGAEMTDIITLENGHLAEITVSAFWEKNFWFEFSAIVNDQKFSETFYS